MQVNIYFLVEQRDSELNALLEEFRNGETGIVYNSFQTPEELRHMVKSSIMATIRELFE